MGEKTGEKLITFAVPCYNSQDYMAKCIESLLVAGDEAEIVIVDDGSTDGTAQIADEYAEKYPDIIRVIHKPNGGHGSAVNAGLEAATGIYYKVVDSDDWLYEKSLHKLLADIRESYETFDLPDMYICDFVYNHTSDNTAHISSYEKKMDIGDVDMERLGTFHVAHAILMHAIIYRTETLRRGYKPLPEHTFYVDDIFCYSPLPRMKKVRYLPHCLYVYFIGREDQSVNIKTAISRYKQQILVLEEMFSAYSYDELKALPKGLKKYMFHFLDAVTMNTLMFSCGKYSKERKADVKAMWAEFKEKDKKLYRHLRYRSYVAILIPIPYRIRGGIMMASYKILNRFMKFG